VLSGKSVFVAIRETIDLAIGVMASSWLAIMASWFPGLVPTTPNPRHYASHGHTTHQPRQQLSEAIADGAELATMASPIVGRSVDIPNLVVESRTFGAVRAAIILVCCVHCAQ
jgi:hypothetical protein